jgi:hypothetical protein
LTDRIEFRSGVLRNNLIWQSRFNIAGVAVSIFFWRRYDSHLLAVSQLIPLLGSFVQHGWLTLRRPKISVGTATILYLINLFIMNFMLWIGNAESAKLPRIWEPFEAHKLCAIAAPLFAPARAGLGAAGSLLFAATASVQYVLFPPEVRARMVEDEPWATIVFCLFGLILCALKVWNQRLQNREVRSRVEVMAMKRTHSRLHALRDLMNTPLSTARIGTVILRRRNAKDADVLDRMDRALLRISDVHLTIKSEESALEERKGHLSFNAEKRLQGSRRRFKLRSEA